MSISYECQRRNGVTSVWVWGDGLTPYELPPVCFTQAEEAMQFGWGPFDPSGLINHLAKALVRHITGSAGAASRYYLMLTVEILYKLDHRRCTLEQEALRGWLIDHMMADLGWRVPARVKNDEGGN